MDILTELEHTTTSLSYVMNKYFNEIQGYITAENAKDVILYARNKFIEASKQRNGFPFIPTVFRNSPKRYEFLRDRDKLLLSKQSPKNPPQVPMYQYTYLDDIYMNLMCNIRLNNYRGFIKHGEIARLVCLDKTFCAENAFTELLSAEPRFYSMDFERVKTSKFADGDKSNWGPLPVDCKNSYMYNVDFCAIYPENIVSTVIVTCMECGRFFETIFCDITKELIKKQVMYNMSRLEMGRKEGEESVDVVRLPTHGTLHKCCPFIEGLVGYKALNAVSVFTRSRITLYCTRSSSLGLLVHDQYIEPNLFPTYEELLKTYKLS